MGGGSTGLRSAAAGVSHDFDSAHGQGTDVPFSFPPATRARSGCWRMVKSKSELMLLSNMVSWGERSESRTAGLSFFPLLFFAFFFGLEEEEVAEVVWCRESRSIEGVGGEVERERPRNVVRTASGQNQRTDKP